MILTGLYGFDWVQTTVELHLNSRGKEIQDPWCPPLLHEPPGNGGAVLQGRVSSQTHSKLRDIVD